MTRIVLLVHYIVDGRKCELRARIREAGFAILFCLKTKMLGVRGRDERAKIWLGKSLPANIASFKWPNWVPSSTASIIDLMLKHKLQQRVPPEETVASANIVLAIL